MITFKLKDNFFHYQKMFLIISFLVIPLTIFHIFQSDKINYSVYYKLYFLMIYILILIKKFLYQERFVVNSLTLYCVYYLVSAFILKGGSYLASHYTVALFPLSLLGFYSIMLFGPKMEERFFLTLCTILITIGLVQSGIGMSQVFTGQPDFGMHDDEEGLQATSRNWIAYLIPGMSADTVLASGSYDHFNTLGAFLTMLTPIAFCLWKHYKKNIWALIFIIHYIGVICTFSRGALMSTTAAVAIVYFRAASHKILQIYLVIFLGTVGILVLASTLTKYAEETGNAAGRYETWMYSLKHGFKRPIRLVFGYGIFHYKEKVIYAKTTVIITEDNERIYNNIHSIYVQMFLELGVVGLGLYLFSLFSIIKRCIVKNTIWSYGLIGTIVGYTITQAFDHSYFAGSGLMLFAIIGMMTSYFKEEEVQKELVNKS